MKNLLMKNTILKSFYSVLSSPVGDERFEEKISIKEFKIEFENPLVNINRKLASTPKIAAV